MVRLTRIYTRLGDEGDTHLGDMSRARKTSLRVVAYGEVDELNAAVGVARAQGLPPEMDVRHSPSLGLQLVSTLAGQLSASLSLDKDRKGTAFRIAFGSAQTAPSAKQEVSS